MYGLTGKNLPLALILLSIAPAAAVNVADDLKQVLGEQPSRLTLKAFAAETSLPIIVTGALPERPYPYQTSGKMAGDVLEDMCDFYGYRWRAGENWCFLDPLPGSPDAQAPGIVGWLTARPKLQRLSFEQALALARCAEETLVSLSRGHPAVQRIPWEHWRALRFIASLSPEQQLTARRGKLHLSDLSKEQLALLNELLQSRLMDLDAPADYSLRITRQDDGTGGAQWALALVGHQAETVLLQFASAVSSEPPPPFGEGWPTGGLTRTANGLVQLDVSNWTLQALLESLGRETGAKLKAVGQVAGEQVSAIAAGARPEEIRKGLAAALDAEWHEQDGWLVLSYSKEALETVARHEAERVQTETQEAQEFLSALVRNLNASDRQLHTVAAIDPDMYNQLNRNSATRGAVEVYAGLPAQARASVERNGVWVGTLADLPSRTHEHLRRAVSYITRVDPSGAETPILDMRALAHADTKITFRREESLISLRVSTPGWPSGFAQRFGLAGTTRYAPPDHLGVKPWYLRFPRRVPGEYLKHLRDVRQWRGVLAVRDLAPLAFVPTAAREAVHESVPEVSRITKANQDVLILYALLDPDQRLKMETTGGILLGDLELRPRQQMLAILGHPAAKFRAESYRSSRIWLVHEPNRPDLDCEFRWRIAGRTTVRSLRLPPEVRR